VVSIEDFNSLSERQRRSFRDPYYVAFQLCTRGAAVEAMGIEPEKVAMVYSYNQEFGATKPQEVYSVDQAGGAEKLWHAMKDFTDYGRWMGAYSSSTPAEVVQLQAADLFAYELTKEFENLKLRPKDRMRWGLRQILKLADPEFSLIRFLDRKELLRIIKESTLPCQDGVDEVGDVGAQMVLARRAIADWMQRRIRDEHEDDKAERRIQTVRQFDARIGDSPAQRTEGQAGSGEDGKDEKTEG
jgi:hypothetical protein